MLQELRNHAQGWIAGVIAGVLCLAFALFGVQYYLGGSPDQAAVAKVNGEEISQTQLDTTYQRLRQSVNGSANLADTAFQQQLKERALNGLIQERVLSQAATKAGYTISPAQIGAILQQIPAFQANGQFSPALFQQALQSLSYTVDSFTQDIAKQSLIGQVQRGLTESVFVLPGEIDQRALLDNQQRDFSYLLIPANSAVTPPTSEAINAYYKQHNADFLAPEQFSLQYVVLSRDSIGQKVTVSAQEIQQYYQDNQAAFTPPQQWQIARILIKVDSKADNKAQQAATRKVQLIEAKLKAGQDFAAVAAQSSEDNNTAAEGGMLGWVARGGQESPLLQAAVLLQPGQVSPAVQTSEGWNLVKLLAVKQPQTAPFNTVKTQIEKNIHQQKVDKLVSDQSDQLSNLTYTQPNTLKPAADALGLPIQTTALFTHEGSKTGFIANRKVLAAALSDNVLKQGNNSDVISLDDHTLAVIRVLEHKPATVQPLATVQAAIITMLKHQAAEQAATALGEKITQQLRQGVAASQVAAQNKVSWVQKTAVKRHSSDVPAAILQLAFNQPAPTSAQHVSIRGQRLANGDYAVVIVSNVQAGAATAVDNKQRILLEKQAADELATWDYDLYLMNKMDHAKIKHIP